MFCVKKLLNYQLSYDSHELYLKWYEYIKYHTFSKAVKKTVVNQQRKLNIVCESITEL